MGERDIRKLSQHAVFHRLDRLAEHAFVVVFVPAVEIDAGDSFERWDRK